MPDLREGGPASDAKTASKPTRETAPKSSARHQNPYDKTGRGFSAKARSQGKDAATPPQADSDAALAEKASRATPSNRFRPFLAPFAGHIGNESIFKGDFLNRKRHGSGVDD